MRVWNLKNKVEALRRIFALTFNDSTGVARVMKWVDSQQMKHNESWAAAWAPWSYLKALSDFHFTRYIDWILHQVQLVAFRKNNACRLHKLSTISTSQHCRHRSFTTRLAIMLRASIFFSKTFPQLVFNRKTWRVELRKFACNLNFYLRNNPKVEE